MKVLTDWYPGTVKPVRPGPYLVRFPDARGWSDAVINVWNGSIFVWGDGSRSFANSGSIEWRGLAFDPEAVHGPFTCEAKVRFLWRTPGTDWCVVEVPR